MNYLILGNGWLGNILKEYLGGEIWEGDIRLFNYEVRETLPKVIINTAAKTNIDWVEKNKIEAEDINMHSALDVAQFAKYNNIKYVFFSSACIFESKDEKDIKYEDSTPNPGCFYSKTKAMAEELILEANPDTLIIRPRLPISEKPHPRNTLDKLLKYSRLQTNQESVTIVEDMLPVLKKLIEEDAKGIYHLVNEGTISPAEIGKLLGIKFEPIDKSDMDKMMAEAGKAKRVTTIVGSKRIPLLPNIGERIGSVIEKYESFSNR